MSVQRPRAAVRFAVGAGLVFRGFGLWSSSGRLTLLGLIPSVITFALFAVLVIALTSQLEIITDWLTGWAQGWDPLWRAALRVVLVLAITGGFAVLLALSFAAVTLAIGAPFFDAIAQKVDELLGAGASEETPFFRSALIGIRDSLVLVGIAVIGGLVLFLVGFLPLVGGLVAWIAGALFGGWLLAIELTGIAAERRGIGLGARRRLLAQDRATSLGFGVAVFLLFLFPFGAVIGMPSAVAGGTLLVRKLRGESVASVSAKRR